MWSVARASIAAVAFAGALATAASPARPIDALEQAIAAEPENLALAADYRQRAIAEQAFDRSIALFEKLAKRKASGPCERAGSRIHPRGTLCPCSAAALRP